MSTYRLDDSAEAASRRTGIWLLLPARNPRRPTSWRCWPSPFAEQHPETEIHLYGARLATVPFKATQHGLCAQGWMPSTTAASRV